MFPELLSILGSPAIACLLLVWWIRHTLHLYLVLHVVRTLLSVIAMVHTPDKVMKVILVELLTTVFIHRIQDFTNGSLGH